MVDALNTHRYDGHLRMEDLLFLEEVKEWTPEKKKDQGLRLLADLKLDPPAHYFLLGIVNSIGTPANYDPSNSLCADDLVCLCWMHRKNPDFKIVLEFQLMDMATGFCPQGRTHRLFQTLLAFASDTEYIDKLE